MITNTTIDPPALVAALATNRPLTPGELAALKAEIAIDPTGRGYGGKSAAEVLALLSLPFLGVNPTPEPPATPRTSCTIGELASLAARARMRLVLMAAPPAKVLEIIEQVVPLMLRMDAIDLTEPLVRDQLGLLVALGVLTDAEVVAVTHTPDTSWRPEIVRNPRATDLLGPALQLTLEDLAAVGIG